jgi:hypothetical protein
MLPVSVIALGAMLWAIGSGSGLMRRETWVSLFVAAAGAALVVWFTTAPDPRFAVGIFYAIAIVVLTPTVCRMNCRQRGWLVGSLAATFGIVGLYDRARTEAERHYSTGRVFATLLLPPPPNASGRYIFPNPSLTEHRCDSGLTIYQCDYPWHAPLATVETLYGGWRRLRLRSSQIGLRAGFVRSPGSGA